MITRNSNVSSNLELVSGMDTLAISKIDGKKLAYDADKFSNSNRLAYYVLCNTWFMQIDELIPGGWVPMYQFASVNGIIPLIDLASTEAQRVISTLANEEVPAATNFMFSEIVACIDLDEPESIRKALQVLRYPKRFSPMLTHKLEVVGLNDFIAFNRSVKKIQRQEIPNWLRIRIKDYLEECFPSNSLADGVDGAPYYGHFSSGSAVNSGKLEGHKYFEYIRTFGHFISGLYPRSDASTAVFFPDHEDWIPPYPKVMVKKHNFSQIQAVPKSYKAPRIIASEWADRQFCMQAVRDWMYAVFKTSAHSHQIDLEDQSKSRELAMVGAATGEYATIDLSSASDSLSLSFALSVLPTTIGRVVDEVRSPYFRMPEKVNFPESECHGWRPGDRVIAQMVNTSGAGTTFIVESVLFLAIVGVATDLVSAFTGEKLHDPQVYGDDCVVDTRCFELAMDLLRAVGCYPNAEKSFAGKYTEACGSEWWCGCDIATSYYPRKTMVGTTQKMDADTMAAVIELQHRLYGCRPARGFLCSLVRDFIPNMTSHLPGTDCSDLWEPVPLSVYVLQEDGNFVLDVDQDAWLSEPLSSDPKARENCHMKGKLVGRPNEPCKWQHIGKAGQNQLKDVLSVCEQDEVRKSILDMDMYLYVQFLAHGPVYPDRNARLLLVSERRKRNALFSSVKSEYILD